MELIINVEANLCKQSKKMADIKDLGLQGSGKARRSGAAIHGEQELFIWNGCWPAGQGEFQYGWEEPRTVEPKVGSTINGYNFRTDFIRALGNGVVPWTAAKAFYFLHKKILT